MALSLAPVLDIESDFAVLAGLLEELHEHHQPWFPREFRADWRARWLNFLTYPEERLILVARDDDEAVGYINGSIRRNPGLFVETFAYIDDAYVRGTARRQGVGARMLAEFEEWCRGRGVEEVRLGVVAENAIGLGFWRKSGFRPLTYTMTKRLTT